MSVPAPVRTASIEAQIGVEKRQLEDKRDEQVDRLSGGMRRRLDLAAALVRGRAAQRPVLEDVTLGDARRRPPEPTFHEEDRRLHHVGDGSALRLEQRRCVGEHAIEVHAQQRDRAASHVGDVRLDQVTDLAGTYPLLTEDQHPDVACVALNRLPPRYIRHVADLAFYQTPATRGAAE